MNDLDAAELVRTYGPWTSHHIHPGNEAGPPEAAGMGDRRVRRVFEVVRDVRGSVDGLRVLDLGCQKGGFALVFARHGATVVGIDARAEHIAQARSAALDLDVTFEQGDVRDLDHGTFDVVLCLGVLYHLDAPDCFRFLKRLCGATAGFAVIETQVGLTGRRAETWEGREYRGFTYREDTSKGGASNVNPESFWPTRPSLLNALSDVGFATVTELLNPVIPDLAAFRDHLTLLAWKGDPAGRWPERLPAAAHPDQALRYRLLDKALRRRGWGTKAVFPRKPGHGATA